MKQEIPMKQFSPILACLVILALFSLSVPNTHAHAATPTPTAAIQTKPCDSSRSIQVSGVAVVNVMPDRALIKLGVQSNGRSAKEAQAKNSATINAVSKALKSLGIEPKDISTDWYTIEPIYKDYDSLYIEGYRIHNTIEITMRDVNKANNAIVTAFQAGANQVIDVQFYTSELRKYRDQAREAAMKAAREKADALTSTAGTGVHCVLTITENTYSSFYSGGWGWYGYNPNPNVMTQNVIQNVESPSGASATLDDGPLNAGQISVRAEVAVSYGLK
jgi:uncharacterized protein YggE